MHIACECVISKLLALKTLETRLIANVLGLAIPMKLNDPIVRVPPKFSNLFLSCVSAQQTLSRGTQPKNVTAAQGTNKQLLMCVQTAVLDGHLKHLPLYQQGEIKIKFIFAS